MQLIQIMLKKLVSIIEARGLTAWDQEAFDTASLKKCQVALCS